MNTAALKRRRDPSQRLCHGSAPANTQRSGLFNAFPTINYLSGCAPACVCGGVCDSVCARKRSPRRPCGRRANTSKDPSVMPRVISAQRHEVLSTHPPLFSLRLARRRSKMSFSRTPFCRICCTICLLKSTTEDFGK